MSQNESRKDKHARIASQSLTAAEECWTNHNYGRAFAHYLLVLKLNPQIKTEIKYKFSVAFQEWCRELELRSRIQDLFLCYEQACELFPECESAMNAMGTQLFRLGYIDEAASCFRRALRIDPDFLGARENLENVCSHLVERWHFRMLNDMTRNESFKQTIQRAVDTGRKRILDIGAGTGLLSMFAVQAGADATYACEMSKPMYELARDVLVANGMDKAVKIFHKKSQDLKIGEDLDSRVDLVVTETVDAGLLGEHIVPTILHAWSDLLHPGGQVIPGAATVYACGIECEAVRKQNRLLYPGIRHLDLSAVTIICSTGNDDGCHEPYTSENLAQVRSGYKQLTDVQEILELDFNNPKSLEEITSGTLKELHFPIVASGRLDAIAMWFSLKLDADVTFTTAPDSPTCWEQAIYPVLHHHLASTGAGQPENLTVRPDDTAIITCQCLRDHIDLKCSHIHRQSEANRQGNTRDSIEQITDALLAMSPSKFESQGYQTLDRPMVGCLNDLRMNTAFCMAIEALRDRLDPSKESRLQLFDLTQGFSPLCLQALKLGYSQAFAISDEHRTILEGVAKGNDIPFDQLTYTGRNFDELGLACDVLVCDIVESCGALRQQVLEDIALARLQCLKPSGHMIPQQVAVYGMMIESQVLSEDSHVLSSNATTLGLDVARFMNDFQMTTHVDIDLLTLPHTRLTEPFKLFTLNLDEKSTGNTPTFLDQENTENIEIVKEGLACAVIYWFDFTLLDNIKLCTLDANSHWKQAAVIMKVERLFKVRETVTVRAVLKNSCIDIKVE